MKRLIISELEKKIILEKYGILNEQTQPVTQPQSNVEDESKIVLNVDKNVTFPAGYYNQSYLENSEIQTEINKVIDFLDKNKNTSTTQTYIVSLTIESGESQIPNTDNENGRVKVEPGFLANERGKSIVNFVKTLLGNRVQVEPTIVPPKIGKTEWVGQVFCPKNKLTAGDTQGYVCLNSNFRPAPNVVNWQNGKKNQYKDLLTKYIEEQYVRVNIIVKQVIKKPVVTLTPTNRDTDVKPECLKGMTIQLNYTDLSKQHVCNSAIYEVYLRGNNGETFLLTRDDGAKYASLNNNAKKLKQSKNKDLLDKLLPYDNDPDKNGGRRYNNFIVTDEMVSEFVKKGSNKFTVIAKCLNPMNLTDWNGGCHKGVGNIEIVTGLGEKFSYLSQTPDGRDKSKELVTVNSCGKKVK